MYRDIGKKKNDWPCVIIRMRMVQRLLAVMAPIELWYVPANTLYEYKFLPGLDLILFAPRRNASKYSFSYSADKSSINSLMARRIGGYLRRLMRTVRFHSTIILIIDETASSLVLLLIPYRYTILSTNMLEFLINWTDVRMRNGVASSSACKHQFLLIRPMHSQIARKMCNIRCYSHFAVINLGRRGSGNQDSSSLHPCLKYAWTRVSAGGLSCIWATFAKNWTKWQN